MDKKHITKLKEIIEEKTGEDQTTNTKQDASTDDEQISKKKSSI